MSLFAISSINVSYGGRGNGYALSNVDRNFIENPVIFLALSKEFLAILGHTWYWASMINSALEVSPDRVPCISNENPLMRSVKLLFWGPL